MPRVRELPLLREDIDPPRQNITALLREVNEQIADLLRRGA